MTLEEDEAFAANALSAFIQNCCVNLLVLTQFQDSTAGRSYQDRPMQLHFLCTRLSRPGAYALGIHANILPYLDSRAVKKCE